MIGNTLSLFFIVDYLLQQYIDLLYLHNFWKDLNLHILEKKELCLFYILYRSVSCSYTKNWSKRATTMTSTQKRTHPMTDAIRDNRGGHRLPPLSTCLFAVLLTGCAVTPDPISQVERSERDAAIDRAQQDYADRLAHYCCYAPYNWFNFFDFWAPAPQAW